jgi:hypothetical protein
MTMRGPFALIMTWLFAVAAIALSIFAVAGMERARNVRDVMANGTEAMALVAGGANGIRQRGDGSFSVDLAWSDAAGGAHKSRGLWINDALAKQVLAAGGGDEALMIKYLADRPPVIVRQAAHDQESNRLDIVWGGAGAVLAGLGAAVLAWLGRGRALNP